MELQKRLSELVDISVEEIEKAFDDSANTSEFIENLEYDSQDEFRSLSQFETQSLRLYYNSQAI